MSAVKRTKRLSVTALMARKNAEPLVCLAAYTAPMARLLDPLVDLLLVGDSLGMVIYGYNSTLPVTLDLMIQHGKAVVAHSSQAMVVVDMPFGSYQASPEQAFLAAARVMQETGCSAVKLEGGAEMAETIRFLTQRGIPVMGHVGLVPQSVNALGGYGVRGRSDAEAAKIIADAKAVTEAGAFAIVIENVVETLAQQITQQIAIPTIGIGASAACDGQVLVLDDMLGVFETVPRFVKRYADLNGVITQAVKDYAEEVRNRRFPTSEHCAVGKGEKL